MGRSGPRPGRGPVPPAPGRPRVTWRVLASGNFSTTSSRPGPSPKTASPISGWWSSTTSATSPRRSALPCPSGSSSTATWARSSAVAIGRTCRIPSRWLGVSMNPPVPGVDASRKVSGDTARALPVVSTTWLRVTPCSRSRSGSARTWSCRSRWPQMATLATPGTPTRWGRIVQRASTDSSIGDSSLDDSPTISTRLVDDSGWSICGGLDTWGSACAWIRRSCTTWRARSGSVPGSKSSSIRDSPGIDSERIVSSQATPLSRSCSSGTVISCSTSAADNPRASVWTSTVGGENSGSMSTGRSRSRVAPTTSNAAATTSTTPRDRRLHPTIHPITDADLPPRIGVSDPRCRWTDQDGVHGGRYPGVGGSTSPLAHQVLPMPPPDAEVTTRRSRHHARRQDSTPHPGDIRMLSTVKTSALLQPSGQAVGHNSTGPAFT